MIFDIRKQAYIASLLFLFVFLFIPTSSVFAEEHSTLPRLIPNPSGTCPKQATEKCKPDGYCYVDESTKFSHSGVDIQCNYSVCDFLQLGVNFASIILYLFLGVAFILLLWGSIGFVTSRGKPEAVQQNMALLKGTIFGVIIILVAWQLVAIIISILSPGKYSDVAKSPLYFFGTQNQNVQTQCLDRINNP